MFGINPYIIGGVGLVLALLGGALWIEHGRLGVAQEMSKAIEAQRDQWKTNAEGAAKAAAENAAQAKAFEDRVAFFQSQADQVRADLASAQSNVITLQRKVSANANHKLVSESCPGVSTAIGMLTQPAATSANHP